MSTTTTPETHSSVTFVFTAGGEHYVLGEQITEQLEAATKAERDRIQADHVCDQQTSGRRYVFVNVSCHSSTAAFPHVLDQVAEPIVSLGGNNYKRHARRAATDHTALPLKIWVFPGCPSNLNSDLVDAMCRAGLSDSALGNGMCLAGRVNCFRSFFDVFAQTLHPVRRSRLDQRRAYLHLDFEEGFLRVPGNSQKLARVVGRALAQTLESPAGFV